MIKRLLVIMALVVFCGLNMTAQAATKEDVAQAINSMKSAEKSGKLLSFKDYGYGTFQCVYVVNGKRYTAYRAASPDGGWLSFWVRPNGTSGQELIKTFSDHHFDGVVEFGIQGGPDERLFDIIDYNNRIVGQKDAAYWQLLYNTAIADTLKHLN